MKLGGTLAEPSLAVDAARTAIALGKTIGGVLLFGPVGVAAALISFSSGDENPCLAAIHAAENGVPPPTGSETQKAVEDAVSEAQKGIKDAVGEVGKTFKGLFGGGD